MATLVSSPSRIRPPLHLVDTESDLLVELALRIEARQPLVARMLLDEIDRAEIHDADDIPPDVVRIGSHVDFVDEGSGRLRSVQLVMPAEADIESGRVSILTPIGAGLIGLAAGQTIDWPDIDGHQHRLRILAVGHAG